MKYINSKKLSAAEEANGANDLIRSVSVKSNPSARGDAVESLSTEPTHYVQQPPAVNNRKRSVWLPLALIALLAIAGTGLGLGAASLAQINSNDDTIAQLQAQIAQLTAAQQGTNRAAQDIATMQSQLAASAANGSSNASANGSCNNGQQAMAFPDVLLRSTPNNVDGYSFSGSLYRGAGYWAVRPSAALQRPRSNHAIVATGQTIYMFGGRVADTNATTSTSDDVIVFDAVLGLYGAAPLMPEGRSAATAALAGGKVYVVGGYANLLDEDRGNPVTTMLVYDVNQGRWSRLGGPNRPRAEACAVAVNNNIYVVGGYRQNHSASDAIEMLNVTTGNWTVVAKTPGPLGNVGCAAVGTKIYIAGGTPVFEGTIRSGSVATLYSFNTVNQTLTALANMTMPRSNFQLVAANDADGSIMAIGGQQLALVGSTSYMVAEPTVEAYLPRHDVWIRRAPMANARFASAAAAVGNSVFVFGGNAVCQPADNRCRVLGSVESLQFSNVPDAFVHTRNSSVNATLLSVNTSVCTTQSDVMLSQQHNGTLQAANGADFRIVGSLYMAQGYWSMQEALPTGPLSDMQVVAASNGSQGLAAALLTGGLSEGVVSNQTWLFDGVLNLWSPRGDMPEPRTRHAAAMLDYKLYLIGGFDSAESNQEGEVVGSMLVYDVATDQWSIQRGPNVLRTDACAASVQGKLYVAGGYSNGFNSTLSSVEVYDPDTRTWSSASPMPTPRGDVMCATLNGELVVVGGYYDPAGNWTPNSFRTEVEAFNPTTGQWRKLRDMPIARGDMAIAELPNGRLMVLGGETTDLQGTRTMVSSNGVFEYISSQDIWIQKAPMIETRFRFDAAYLNNAVYVFGGDKSSSTGNSSIPMVGHASVESYHYTPVPDVFVWMQVPKS